MDVENVDLTLLAQNYNDNTRALLKEIFKNNIVDVTFTKKDGTVRELRGTLKPEYLPEHETPYTGFRKADNPDILAVWDVKQAAWRSFRLDSVTKIIVGCQ